MIIYRKRLLSLKTHEKYGLKIRERVVMELLPPKYRYQVVRRCEALRGDNWQQFSPPVVLRGPRFVPMTPITGVKECG
jgi:hypothetical protein